MSVYDGFCLASINELRKLLVVAIFPRGSTKVRIDCILAQGKVSIRNVVLENDFPDGKWTLERFSIWELDFGNIFQTGVD